MIKQALIRIGFYPTLWFTRLMCISGIWRSWDMVDDWVAVGNLPTRSRIKLLADQGFGAVVNLCQEFGGYNKEMSQCGLQQLHLSTLDYHPPTIDDIARGIDFIFEQIGQQRKVYVHCKAGRGRSATLVLCYLMVAHRINSLQAYERIIGVRPHIDRILSRQFLYDQVRGLIEQGRWSDQKSSQSN